MWNGEDSALVRCPPSPQLGQPLQEAGTGTCQPSRGHSCLSPAPSWSWTPSMPTRRVVSAETSTGSGPSTSSMPTVSARRQGWPTASPGWTVPGRLWGGAQPGTGQRDRWGPWAASPALPSEPLCVRDLECLLCPDARLTPLQFGNLQKLDGPTEQCQDPPPAPADNCTDRVSACPGVRPACSPRGAGCEDSWGWGVGCPGGQARARPPLRVHPLLPHARPTARIMRATHA